MLELARRKSSTGKLYRRVKKDPSGATRQSLPVPRRAQPIILERRRLEHDDLICIAQNCANNGMDMSFSLPTIIDAISDNAASFRCKWIFSARIVGRSTGCAVQALLRRGI
jgi:hypothetical protein